MRIDYVRMQQRKMLLLCAFLAATTEALRPPAKVVVLDAYTATAGVFSDRDAAWRPALRAGDELVVYDRTAPSDVVERLSGADVAVVNKVLITDSLLSAVPSLGNEQVRVCDVCFEQLQHGDPVCISKQTALLRDESESARARVPGHEPPRM